MGFALAFCHRERVREDRAETTVGRVMDFYLLLASKAYIWHLYKINGHGQEHLACMTGRATMFRRIDCTFDIEMFPYSSQ
jgi:hypothetical protein